MICLNGLVLRRDSLHSASNARFLMDSMFDFAERMNGLQLTDHEIGLFCAVVVIAPGKSYSFKKMYFPTFISRKNNNNQTLIPLLFSISSCCHSWLDLCQNCFCFYINMTMQSIVNTTLVLSLTLSLVCNPDLIRGSLSFSFAVSFSIEQVIRLLLLRSLLSCCLAFVLNPEVNDWVNEKIVTGRLSKVLLRRSPVFTLHYREEWGVTGGSTVADLLWEGPVIILTHLPRPLWGPLSRTLVAIQLNIENITKNKGM